MRLPAPDLAIVSASKIRDYLLSDSHPVGRFKCAFFVALGYSAARWEELASDLQRHALDNEATATEFTPYGQKYEVRGTVTGPTSRSAIVVVVWIVHHGEDFPRFVTAFPGPRS